MANAPATAAADHIAPVQALMGSYQSGIAPPAVAVSAIRTVTLRRKTRFAIQSVEARVIRVSAALGMVLVVGWRLSSPVSALRPARVRPAPIANSQFASCQ